MMAHTKKEHTWGRAKGTRKLWDVEKATVTDAAKDRVLMVVMSGASTAVKKEGSKAESLDY